MKIEKIKIGVSDYTREQMSSGESYWFWGTSSAEYLENILAYEADGYKVEFKTSIFRKLFCLGIYKVVATKIIQ